jgi:acyl-coenzyme A synthetase/AMP-(fatty) acid ligase
MRVVHEVAKHAVASPHAIAVSSAVETAVTYGQLMASVNAVAHMLRQQDVGKGDYVGIMLERCVVTWNASSIHHKSTTELLCWRICVW